MCVKMQRRGFSCVGVADWSLARCAYGALPLTAKHLHVINNPYQPTLALHLPCVGDVKIYIQPALAAFCSAINQTPRLDAALQKESRFCSRLAFRDIPLELEFAAVLPENLSPLSHSQRPIHTLSRAARVPVPSRSTLRV
jgi:hypothetical protein